MKRHGATLLTKKILCTGKTHEDGKFARCLLVKIQNVLNLTNGKVGDMENCFLVSWHSINFKNFQKSKKNGDQ